MNAESLCREALVLMRQGDVDRARKRVDSALALNPGLQDAYSALGGVARESRQ